MTTLLLSLLFGTVAAYAVIKYENPELTNISYNTLAHYKMNLKGQDNEIILAGDSALLMGIIPRLVEERTGHTVINLGLYGNCGVAAMVCLLDRYLEHNKKPAALVFYFAASTPYFFADQKYEKTYTLLKYSSLPLRELRHDISLSSVYATARTIVSRSATSFIHHQKSLQQFREDIAFLTTMKGFGKNPATQTPLYSSINVDSRQNRTLDLSFMKALRERYEQRGIRVLFHIAPMPEGDRAFSYFQKEYTGHCDNLIKRLPDHLFTDHTHMTPEGARLNSYLIADDLSCTLTQSDKPHFKAQLSFYSKFPKKKIF